ncbi:hypothetical protein [Agrococcus sediminis]|uniref:hypothetical protein n=1 Tax=Agrococcus sediminis TaxID=2599924 RepID=UPI003440B4B6
MTTAEEHADRLDALADQLDDGPGIAKAYVRGLAEGLRRAADWPADEESTDKQ